MFSRAWHQLYIFAESLIGLTTVRGAPSVLCLVANTVAFLCEAGGSKKSTELSIGLAHFTSRLAFSSQIAFVQVTEV